MVTSKVTLGSHCTECFSGALSVLEQHSGQTAQQGNTQYCKGDDQCAYRTINLPLCDVIDFSDCTISNTDQTVGVCLGCALFALSLDTGTNLVDDKRLKEIWKEYKKAKCCDVKKETPKPNDYLCKDPCKVIECAIKTYKKEDIQHQTITYTYVLDLSHYQVAVIAIVLIVIFLLFIVTCSINKIVKDGIDDALIQEINQLL